MERPDVVADAHEARRAKLDLLQALREALDASGEERRRWLWAAAHFLEKDTVQPKLTDAVEIEGLLQDLVESPRTLGRMRPTSFTARRCGRHAGTLHRYWSIPADDIHHVTRMH
jgi:hypothetical protein